MKKWKDIVKINAHLHLFLSDYILNLSSYGCNEWNQANIKPLLIDMKRYNIEKVIVVPDNRTRWSCEIRKVNEFMASIRSVAPDRIYSFSALSLRGGDIQEAIYELEFAVKELNLCGLRIHPVNMTVPIDDVSFLPLLQKAASLNIPILVHSYPWGMLTPDLCAPHRIVKASSLVRNLNIITAHMGGMKHLDSVKNIGSVVISDTLFDLVKTYGMEGANRVLRKLGAHNIMFAADLTNFDFDAYFEILDQMDFSDEEQEQIAYGNIFHMLKQNS